MKFLAIAIVIFIVWFIYAYRRETGWKGYKDFETDGCSGGLSAIYNFFTGKELSFVGCCEKHDIPYWKGGTKEEKEKADIALKNCVDDRSDLLSTLMYHAVRLGGVAWLPTTYRWGYGKAYELPWRKSCKE
ncbi:MAG TPA: hypothetical protein DCS48_07520 [Desulfovibrio sp.]|nr:hypothetical protein [Desulfovibrio sp.]